MTGAILEALARIALRPSEEWPARLAKAFPDDAALRAQALLWLHADRQTSRGADAPPELGASAERYELSLRIDAGATATVWQAYDRKLGRNVAIKVFHLDDPDAVDQVLVEARAASDVISDHVVRVLDVNGDDEHPHIVMELVAEHDPERDVLALGTSAAQCVPLSVDEVARWLVQIARGVHDAHLRNVFHRDLKPQNVVLTPISRRARIADFGIAISGSLQRTAGSLSVRGTPEYMAPEQARGLPPALDARDPHDRAALVAVDVWGLGAIAFHLLAGRPPWTRDERTAWEVAASGTPASLPARTQWGERIPRRLRAVIEKTLRPDPRARYANASVVANELAAYLARKPTSLEGSRVGRLGLWCRRNPQLALTVLLSAGLALLTAGTHASVAQLRTERDQLDRELAEQVAERDQLDRTMEQTRAALLRTKARLASELANLAVLEKSIDDDRRAHAALLEVKETELRRASSAARQLLERLEAARDDRRAADIARASYEKLSADTKRDAERLAKERDRARKDRDAARGERDALQRELDAMERELSAAQARTKAAQAELARREKAVNTPEPPPSSGT